MLAGSDVVKAAAEAVANDCATPAQEALILQQRIHGAKSLKAENTVGDAILECAECGYTKTVLLQSCGSRVNVSAPGGSHEKFCGAYRKHFVFHVSIADLHLLAQAGIKTHRLGNNATNEATGCRFLLFDWSEDLPEVSLLAQKRATARNSADRFLCKTCNKITCTLAQFQISHPCSKCGYARTKELADPSVKRKKNDPQLIPLTSEGKSIQDGLLAGLDLTSLRKLPAYLKRSKFNGNPPSKKKGYKSKNAIMNELGADGSLLPCIGEWLKT